MNRSVVRAVLWALVGAAAVTVIFVLGPFASVLGLRDYTMAIRSYAAPEQMDEAMTDALRSALQGHGRVTAGPNGQLLVTAPAYIQTQIPEIIANVAANAQRPTVIRFEAWSVVATTEGGRPVEDPTFEDIRPALIEIAKGNPSARFQLRENSSLGITSGSTGKNQSMEVRARLRKREDGMEVVAVDLAIGNLKTHVQLVAGELTVLAHRMETSQEVQPGPQGVVTREKTLPTVYHIVRASL